MAGLQELIRSLQEQAAPFVEDVGEGFMDTLDALNKAVAAIIPGTATNKEFTAPAGEALDPVVDAAAEGLRRGSTLSPATQAALKDDDTETAEATTTTADAPRTTNVQEFAETLQPGVKRTETGFRLTREARLAAIVDNARRPDNDASKLAGSLARPLVGYQDANGQVHAAVTERKSSRPWGEMDPTPDIVSYSEDDVIEPATWGSPEKVGRLQHRLVNAGFLTGDFKFGFYDDTTEKAYRDLLTFSSKNGMSMLEGLVEAHQARRWAAKNGVPWSAVGGSAEQGTTLKPPKYQAPDKAEVKQAIKAQFRQELGREPTPGELARFAAGYLEDARTDYDRQVDGMTPDASEMADNVFDEAPELQAGEDGQVSTEPSVERVNPGARFAEAFERRYAGEMQFKDQQETNREQGNLLAGILGTVDRVA